MSFIRSVIDVYPDTWAKYQKYQQMHAESVQQLSGLIRQANQVAHDLPLRRAERTALLAQKTLAKTGLLGPDPSWWARIIRNLRKWRIVRYFIGSTAEERALDRLNQNIQDIQRTIFDLEFQYETTLPIQLKATRLMNGRDLTLKFVAATQLVALVAGSIFAAMTVLTFFSTTGFTAFFLVGGLTVPALIFHDLYFIAINTESALIGHRGVVQTVGLIARTLHRAITETNPNENNVKDLTETTVALIEKETVLLHLFKTPIIKKIVERILAD